MIPRMVKGCSHSFYSLPLSPVDRYFKRGAGFKRWDFILPLSVVIKMVS